MTMLVGDCRTLMPGEGPFDLIIADPPYGDTALAWDRRVEGWLPLAHAALRPTGSLWVFGSLRFFMATAAQFDAAGWLYVQDVIWQKTGGAGFQADRAGNLNVSKFGSRLAGAGGFINISQNAKQVVFLGTFSAGPQDIRIEDGQLRIIKDGELCKFVAEVEHRTFAGHQAAERGQPVLYVTERCVFRLTLDGLELIEVAPGVDIQRDILDRMDFTPIVRTPQLMDARLFLPPPIGLSEQLNAD